MTTEHATVRQIIRTAKSLGYVISVYDGEEWAVKRSDDEKAIFEAATSVDECTLTLRDALLANKDGKVDRVGNLYLVFGNASDGSELMADYTDNDDTRAFVKAIEKAMGFPSY